MPGTIRMIPRWPCAVVVLAALVASKTASAGVVMNATRYVYPFMLAAWRIRGHLHNDSGDVWTRASNYHSRTPRFNRRYRADLIRRAVRWTTWLDSHFPTHDVVVDVTPYGTR
jgi:hypothetical protein